MIEAVETLILPRFDRMETRLDGVETRLDGVETRLDGVETRLDGVETRLAGVETRLGRLELSHDELGRRFGAIEAGMAQLDSIDNRLKALENDIREIYKILNEKPLHIDKTYQKLSDKQKLVRLHQETLALAQKMGVALPGSS